jgi:predicted MPP superfamily phosphohydrolase
MRPRPFGRALHLGPRHKLRELLLDRLFAGAWPTRVARPLGLAGRLHVTRHDVHLPASAPGAPAAPLRVAFAADLHAGPGTHPRLVERACEVLAAAQPDLLLLGGDFVGFHARHIDRLVPLLRAIPAPLGKLAVLGNHDLMADDAWVVARLADAGVRTLVNEPVRLPAPWDGVWVCGLDDWNQGTPDAARAFAGVPADAARLLLMHSPDGLDVVGDDHAFVAAFCGHVHGGQFVRADGGDTPLSSRSKGATSRRYQRGGAFRVGLRGDRFLLVTRGIGCTTLPLRRHADPEVHVCPLTFGAPALEMRTTSAPDDGRP